MASAPILSALLVATQAPALSVEQAELHASDGGAISIAFGNAVAVDGTTAVVGARGASGSWPGSGAAYVFVVDTCWKEQAKLFESGIHNAVAFATAVAISGDTVVVGSPHDTSTTKDAAYVFVRSGTQWSEEAELVSSAPIMSAFGRAVGVSGDTAVVSDPTEHHLGAFRSGAAYVFARGGGTWAEQAKLVSSDLAPEDHLGSAVAIDGDTLLVGAPDHDHLGDSSGAAYVFVRSGTTWVEQAELLPSDGAAFGFFGQAVDVRGDTLVVGGAPAVGSTGAAYVFVRSGSTWTEQAKLLPDDGADGDRFGRSVATWGDLALIGAPGHAAGGAAYVFLRSGASWNQDHELASSGLLGGDGFGDAVSLDGGTAVIGAPYHDEGAAFAFGAAPLAQPVAYCTAGSSSVGCRATLSACGWPSASAPSGFLVTATDVEAGRDGLFFFGSSGRQASPWGNGTSYQCVVPPVRRAGSMTGVGTAPSCDGAFTQDLNARWCPTCPKPHHNPGAGALVQLQLWYRDPWNTSNRTTSLSNAIEFDVVP